METLHRHQGSVRKESRRWRLGTKRGWKNNRTREGSMLKSSNCNTKLFRLFHKGRSPCLSLYARNLTDELPSGPARLASPRVTLKCHAAWLLSQREATTAYHVTSHLPAPDTSAEALRRDVIHEKLGYVRRLAWFGALSTRHQKGARCACLAEPHWRALPGRLQVTLDFALALVDHHNWPTRWLLSLEVKRTSLAAQRDVLAHDETAVDAFGFLSDPNFASRNVEAVEYIVKTHAQLVNMSCKLVAVVDMDHIQITLLRGNVHYVSDFIPLTWVAEAGQPPNQASGILAVVGALMTMLEEDEGDRDDAADGVHGRHAFAAIPPFRQGAEREGQAYKQRVQAQQRRNLASLRALASVEQGAMPTREQLAAKWRLRGLGYPA